jgi:hypothetical protein
MNNTNTLSEAKNDDLLYHYTDANGLIGIIKNKRIWLSNLHFLNDSSELELSKIIFNEIIVQKKIFFDKDIEGLFNKYISKNYKMKTCAISFCEEGNSLNQWQGYSGGVNGFSIGFDKKELKKLENQNIELIQCIYDRDIQKKMVEDIVNKIDKEEINNIDDLSLWMESLTICEDIHKIAPKIKNYHFYLEKEWRLVVNNIEDQDNNYCFRNKNGILPYYEINIENYIYDLIKSIYIGPSENSTKSEFGVVELLECCGFKNIQDIIRVSKIPYRN